MPAQNLIEFVIYILPGFLAMEINNAFYPGRQKSDFVQGAWSLVYGVVIYTAVRYVDDNVLNNALYSYSEEFPNIPFISTLFVAALALGSVCSLVHYLRIKVATKYAQIRWLLPDPQSIWAKINEASNRNWAVVYLDDNSIYLGYISEYTFDPSAKDNDFLLAAAKRVREDLSEIYIVNGVGVYLNTRNVKRIEYLRSTGGASSP